MKPELNALGKIRILGSEISGSLILKAGYTIEQVLAMDSEAEQQQVLDKIEYNRRLERANEDDDDSGGGRTSGVTFHANNVYIGGHVFGRDGRG